MSYILGLDNYITTLLRNIFPHNIFFNNFFSFFSMSGSAIVVWLLVIALALLFEERKNPGISLKDKKFAFVFSAGFLITILSVNFLLKNVFQRSRPYYLPVTNHQSPTTNNSCPTDYSFPSTHAATAFVSATVLTYFDKKRRWFYYSVAFLIGFSRIFLGCHYFIDVTVGSMIGFIIAKIILLI